MLAGEGRSRVSFFSCHGEESDLRHELERRDVGVRSDAATVHAHRPEPVGRRGARIAGDLWQPYLSAHGQNRHHATGVPLVRWGKRETTKAVGAEKSLKKAELRAPHSSRLRV